MLVNALKAQRTVLGDQHTDTVTGMERLAGIYRRSGRYDAAQALLSEATEACRRAGGAKDPDTVEDLALLGLVGLQQQKYSEVESLLKDFVVRDASAPDTWWRFLATSLLGAALSAEKKYEAAEPLLIDGYNGLAERAAVIPADSRAALARAGEWIVQLYRAWGKPDRVQEWSDRLDHAGKTPQQKHQ
jgi:eukaryotic-like serine/threonine-protein kinase